MQSVQICMKLSSLKLLTSNPLAAVDIFDNYIKTVIDGIFRKIKNNINTSTFPCYKWFDEECKVEKRRLRDISKKGMTENNRSIYHRLMREYKALIQRKKRSYQLMIASEMSPWMRHSGILAFLETP